MIRYLRFTLPSVLLSVVCAISYAASTDVCYDAVNNLITQTKAVKAGDSCAPYYNEKTGKFNPWQQYWLLQGAHALNQCTNSEYAMETHNKSLRELMENVGTLANEYAKEIAWYGSTSAPICCPTTDQGGKGASGSVSRGCVDKTATHASARDKVAAALIIYQTQRTLHNLPTT